jgi:hypothetical protein
VAPILDFPEENGNSSSGQSMVEMKVTLESDYIAVNVTSFLKSNKVRRLVKKGLFEENPCIRAGGINTKFGVLTLLFHGNCSETRTVNIALEYEERVIHRSNSSFKNNSRHHGAHSQTSKVFILLHVTPNNSQEDDVSNRDLLLEGSNSTFNSMEEETLRDNLFSLRDQRRVKKEAELKDDETEKHNTSSHEKDGSISKIQFHTKKKQRDQLSFDLKREIVTATSSKSLTNRMNKKRKEQTTSLNSEEALVFLSSDENSVTQKEILSRWKDDDEDSQARLVPQMNMKHATGLSKSSFERKRRDDEIKKSFNLFWEYRPFPWERISDWKQREHKELQSNNNESNREGYVASSHRQRHLMDAYGDSLRHVNRLYNRVFGAKTRRVPAHMSHFIDVDIVKRMHSAFHQDFQATSSHQIRSDTDMQFAFSYFYFLLSESRKPNVSCILEAFDSDHDGYRKTHTAL